MQAELSFVTQGGGRTKVRRGVVSKPLKNLAKGWECQGLHESAPDPGVGKG